MNEQVFVDRRDQDWKRLSDLADKVEGKDTRNLSPDEFREFVKLYRRASTDLAIVRTKSRNLALVDYLNDLVGRSYSLLYRAPRKPVLPALAAAIRTSAQTVRARRAYVLVSAAIFFGAWLFVFGAITVKPEVRDVVVSPQMEENFKDWQKGKFEQRSAGESVAANGMYASNNPRVSIIAGSIGAGTFGIGSIYMLFQNGAIIGALSYDMNQVGKVGFLLGSIFPHGVTELSGIIVSGAAGLMLGWALINPRRLRRGDALKEAGRDAMTLLLTSVVLMFMAAPIEAYFSFNPAVPMPAKVAFAVFSAIGWLAFWTSYGKEPVA